MSDETREDRLAREVHETDQLNGRLAHLLHQTADALKGDPGPMRLHDWSDLPAVAEALRRERDELRADLESAYDREAGA